MTGTSVTGQPNTRDLNPARRSIDRNASILGSRIGLVASTASQSYYSDKRFRIDFLFYTQRLIRLDFVGWMIVEENRASLVAQIVQLSILLWIEVLNLFLGN